VVVVALHLEGDPNHGVKKCRRGESRVRDLIIGASLGVVGMAILLCGLALFDDAPAGPTAAAATVISTYLFFASHPIELVCATVISVPLPAGLVVLRAFIVDRTTDTSDKTVR